MLPDDATAVISSILAAVVAGDYASAIALGDSARCSTDDLERVMREYNQRVIAPPHEFLDALPVHSSSDQMWSVTAPFWNPLENSRSDLELRLTVTIIDGASTIELDDMLAG
jgi:hypothetical protein